MSKVGECLTNIATSNRDELCNCILVVSRSDNVANRLLEHKKTGDPGVCVKFLHGEESKSALDDLYRRPQAINAGFADIDRLV
jgi:aspartate kinase